MRRILTVVLCAGILSVFANTLKADDVDKAACTGTVVNDQNQPIEGAKVTLYELGVSSSFLIPDLKTKEDVITKTDGKFAFTIKKGTRFSQVMITAQKDGLAMDWANWLPAKDQTFKMTLGKPMTLAGVVVDDANEPVYDAEVRVMMMVIGELNNPQNNAQKQPRFLIGMEPFDILVTRTNEWGRFSFNNIPADAAAEFMVRKTGRAVAVTMNLNGYGGGKPQFTAGQDNIRIVQTAGGKIEGKVVQKSNGKPVGGVKILLTLERNSPSLGTQPVTSAADGTFAFNDVPAGSYAVILVPIIEGVSEWTSEPVDANVETGKTTSGITLWVNKGGILEVLVTDVEKKAIEGASVYVRPSSQQERYTIGRSDKNGIAAIRLNPGEYRLINVYKEGYASVQQRGEPIAIENGKIAHLEIQLSAPPKITGVVLDEAGKAVEGINLMAFPWGGREDIKTDAQGKFELTWQPETFGPGNERTSYLIARQESKNLAAAVEITRETKTIDIKLAPGLIFAGKVTDPNNKPIAGASVSVTMWSSNNGSNMGAPVKTDKQGKFEIKAIPAEGRYSMSISADGFGTEQFQRECLQQMQPSTIVSNCRR